MSFILEALKKSEQESRSAASPDLSTALTGTSAGKRGRRIPLLLLLLALVANALLFLSWLRPWSPAAVVPVAADTAAARPIVGAPAAPVNAADRLPPSSAAAPEKAERLLRQAPAGWNELPTSVPPAQVAAAGSKKGAPPIPLLRDLPADIRRQIPALAITLHYYTADPAARLARVNGVILREGQAVGRHLVLERITAETIIFRLGDTRFRAGEF